MALRLPRLPDRAARRSASASARDARRPDQSGTTLHTPPAVPDDLETFSHTGVVPTTYAQLNFSQGTSLVSAHMSILARQANASTSFLEPASQLGVTDLYVSVLPRLERARTEIFVGAFASRYGSPGEYDEGRYGTPLIARVNGIGQRVSVRAPFGAWTLMAEEGLAGQSNKANAATTPDVWNDFANPSEGTSFVAHGHAGRQLRALRDAGPAPAARVEPGRSRQQQRGRGAGHEHQPAGRAPGHLRGRPARDRGPLRPPLPGGLVHRRQQRDDVEPHRQRAEHARRARPDRELPGTEQQRQRQPDHHRLAIRPVDRQAGQLSRCRSPATAPICSSACSG